MPSLPENPNLENLRHQARALQRESGRPLHVAQFELARSYGFASWPRLKQFVATAAEHTWQPQTEPAAESPADHFCRYACLSYTDADGPDRWERARALLPEIGGDVWAEAAAGRVTDPAFARTKGGPYGWTPLCYLAYSRVLDGDPEEAVRALLEAGADPNEGHLWNGLPTPFTILTGLFGHGEIGPRRQPPHPRADALARLVLAGGADPNDGQTLYNRQFDQDDSHLRLLFEFGLGRGDGGPWRRRLGEQVDGPAELLRKQLRWAIEHGMEDRVRLLVANRVDVVSPYSDGRTPMDLAVISASATIVGSLAKAGAKRAELDPADEVIAALFAGTEIDDGALDEARRRRPGLVVWAAARGKSEVVARLVAQGWDVNARSRSDVTREEEWQTALHEAAASNDVALIELLLSLGADRTARDVRFGATPLEWARHLGNEEAATTLQLPTD